MDDTASFPRGGRHRHQRDGGDGTIKKEPSSSNSKRSRENNRDSSNVKKNKKTESEPDFLFGNRDEKNKQNQQRKKQKTYTSGEAMSSSTSHSLLPLGGGGVVVVKKGVKSEKGKAFAGLSSNLLIEAFGFSKLAKGTQVLGIVREVQSEYAIVSLPNMLSGYILPQQQQNRGGSFGGSSLLNCLSVGQILAVVVQKVVKETIGKSHQQQQRRRIQVSPFPGHVNPRGGDEQELFHKKNMKLPIRGQITSIEDHGCLVDLGFGRKGFLKYQDIEGSSYKVLDVDDDVEDEETDDDAAGGDDGKKEKKKKSQGTPYIIQPGRLYDFFVSGNSSSDKIYSLSLPSMGALARQSVAPILNTKSKYSSTTPYTLNSIRPGWLVTAKVEAIAKNGLCVTFLNNVFRGAIELGHLGANFIPTSKESSTAGWHDVFTKHQHFQARVVAIDVPTKMIRLSLAPHILEMKNIMMTTKPTKIDALSPSTSFPEIGSIVKDCTVIRQDPGIGALLALPTSYNRDYETDPLSKRISKSDLFKNEPYAEATKTRAVYVHISKAIEDMDTTGAVFSKDFAPSTNHDVRILGMGSLVDGVATGACAKSILDAHVLTHADLKPGQLYKQVPVCAQLQGGSILVQLGGHKNFNSNTDVRGLIPPMHLFDTSNSSEFRRKLLKAKYAVDAKIDVRVLSVDAKNKKCIVTAKKSMVKVGDESEIVTSFDDLKVGKHAVGYISRIDERNIFVTFCNKVFGRVTAKSLAADLGIEDHTDSYHVGDVVKCRVVKMKKRKSFGGSKANTFEDNNVNYDDSDDEEGPSFWEVDLSLKVDEREGEDDDGEAMQVDNEEKQIRIKAGAILPLKSMKIVQLNSGKIKKNGSFVPGYAIVSIKSKHVMDESMQSGMASNIECKLPYDQLLDSYDPEDVQSAATFDRLAGRLLSVGKKINQKGIILTDPHKSNVDYTTGIGRLPVVSIRKCLIQTTEKQYASAAAKANDSNTTSSSGIIIVPDPDSDLYVGAVLQGYAAQVDPRHGAFIRFLDGMTGLIPKSFGGCDVPAYETVITKIKEIDDTQRPYRILLDLVGDKKLVKGGPYQVGDKIAAACIKDVKFHETELVLPETEEKSMARVVLHSTMKDCKESKVKYRKGEAGRSEKNQSQEISKGHPFYGLKVGENLSDLTVVGLKYLKGRFIVYVTDRSNDNDADNESSDNVAPIFVAKRSELVPGMILTAFIDFIADKNKGIFVHVSPFVKGFIPGVEISRDLRILNSLKKHVKTGTRIKCRVMDQSHWHQIRGQCPFASQHHHSLLGRKSEQADNPQLFLSLISCEEEAIHPTKPKHGDLLVGRIQKSLPPTLPPCLMISLRGGYVARSCITELDETDDWSNMPIGSIPSHSGIEKEHKQDVVDDDAMDVEEEDSGNEKDLDDDEETESHAETDGLYPDGKYVECRVLKTFGKQSLVDVSLRPSRVEGDLDEDLTPEVGETAQGYVVQTNKQGCFIRIARHIEGRATLKELCDGFLPAPETSFPMGRLVVGKVKEVHNVKKKSKNSKDPVRYRIDLDMRESTLLDGGKKIEFEDIELNQKYNGTVTRVESYGVFVQVENSKVSGLVHMSECSDKFIKNLQALYSPGDLVKILVIKKDTETWQLGFSMKPSHFENDEDSEDDSASDGGSEPGDEDQAMLMDQSDDDGSENELDSDDENFASKLAAKMQADADDDENSSDSSSSKGSDDDDDSSDDENSSDDSDEDETKGRKTSEAALDTDVGFEWEAGGPKVKSGDKDDSDDESSSSSDDDDGEDAEKTSSHKSRKKQAQRRREEREIARREIALADGTADENPETAGDFERLLAGNPNSSELWIRYMAFHLSLSDIPAARAVAEKAMERIEFRQEKEKLNVWTALLTLEHKYGDGKSFASAIERACGQNNPKQVYLRACEILEKDASSAHSPDSFSRADNLFSKMCKKFKSKKTVWLAHLQYLLKHHRHQEGHALMKRALLSLPSYKHAETMSRFAQLEFEFGSLERARTVFDGIVEKYPKRLDLFFVYVDKEIKFGSLETARSLLKKKVEGRSLSDKKMKNLFKKWYRLEEEHGNEESQEAVKTSAREYVGNS